MSVTEQSAAPTFTWNAGVHPAADLFPMMDAETFAGLVDDVRENGLIEAVWLTPDGALLDGRNRLAACQVLGIEPKTRTFKGDDPLRFVLGLNVHRRHMTSSQLAVLAIEALPLFAEQADARMKAGRAGPLGPGAQGSEAHRARDEAGAAVGVSGRTVERAKRVQDQAPELLDKVKAGEMSVKAAERLAAAKKKYPVTPPHPGRLPREERSEQIKDLAAAGHNSTQIARELGIGAQQVKKLAKSEGVEIHADAVMGRTRSVDSDRVVGQLVIDADALTAGINLIDYEALDRDQLEAWASSLSASIRSLTTVKNNLNKELTRDQ